MKFSAFILNTASTMAENKIKLLLYMQKRFENGGMRKKIWISLRFQIQSKINVFSHPFKIYIMIARKRECFALPSML